VTARFRPSRPEDSAAIRQILESSGLSLYSTANRPTSSTAGRRDPSAQVVEICVVEADQATVAVLQSRLVADEAEILDIAVASLHRRRGYGRFALSSFIEIARQRDVKALFLEVRESNLPAIRLYQSAGFAATGRRPNYYHHPAEAALLMNLKLTG
jgi:ribosomal-protein-alanine acetyltransferase